MIRSEKNTEIGNLCLQLSTQLQPQSIEMYSSIEYRNSLLQEWWGTETGCTERFWMPIPGGSEDQAGRLKLGDL